MTVTNKNKPKELGDRYIAIAKWLVKNRKIIRDPCLSDFSLLATMVNIFAPELLYLDFVKVYHENYSDFLNKKLRKDYFKKGATPDRLEALSQHIANGFINLFSKRYSAELKYLQRIAEMGYTKHPREKVCDKCQSHYCNSMHTESMRNTTNFNELTICPTCAIDRFRVCLFCNKLIDRVNAVGSQFHPDYENRITLCIDCHRQQYVSCHRCGTYIHTQLVNTLEGNEHTYFCNRCIGGMIGACHKCDTKFSKANRDFGWEGEDSYCDTCLTRSIPYQSYKYKPESYVFRHTSTEMVNDNTLYLGLELEAELGEDRSQRSFARTIKRKFGSEDLYIVHDGSLRHGIEVVPMPFTERWYHEKRDWLKDLYELMTKKGAVWTGKRVGLHIHTSSAAWGKSQIYKLVRFIYGSVLVEDYGLRSILGRFGTRHCVYSPSLHSDALIVAKNKDKFEGNHHYNALNFSNGSTVEFRMFAGAYSFENLLMKIDFVLSCWDFTNAYGYKRMDMSGYTDFLNHNQSKYFRIIKHLGGK